MRRETDPRGATLMLASSYPFPQQAVPAGWLHELAVRMSGTGPVQVLAPGGAGLPATEHRDGVSIERFTYVRPQRLQRLAYGPGMPDNLEQNPLVALSIPPFLGRWVRSATRLARTAGVIQAHWAVPGGLVGALASRATGVPLVVVLHSGGVHALSRTPGGGRLARWIASRARCVVATSGSVGARFRELLGTAGADQARRIREVPLGVDVPAEVRPVYARPSGPAHVVFCGRLVPIKGVDRLLRAVSTRRDIVLDVAGDGPERPGLERLAASLGIPVHFHGWVDASTRARLLDHARCVVIPSGVTADGRTEGMPRVLVEALAAGAPVVASATGDMANPRGDAWLAVPAGDTAALASTLDRVLDDPVLAHALAERGRMFAAERDWTRVGPAHVAVLREALG